MERQKTDWGDILWLNKEQEILSMEGLQVGIVSLYPGAHQPRHIHYEEQVIYVVQGQAISIVDKEKSSLCPGKFFHWKAGVEHEIYNIGNVPFQHLLISNPLFADSEQLFPDTEEGKSKRAIEPDLIYIATEAIRTQFLETLNYGYTIFDSMNNLILQSSYFPEYCVDRCHPELHPGGCLCMNGQSPGDRDKEHTYRCSYGMEVYHYPIVFRKVFLGYIQGGYIRHSNTGEGRIKNVYDVPESVLAGIRALLRRIVKAMTNYCEFEQFRIELMEKELCIASHEEAQRILAKNLRDTQYAMTDLKISNHFLFNTLNSMASMALSGGLMPLYQSIVDLAKMFHYTLQTQNSIVSLEKELEYVQAYLQLQKLRYGDELSVNYRIDKSVLHAKVPFNFLQPIVENAFVHGFRETTQKKIRILIKEIPSGIEIRVANSGTPLNSQACRTVNQGIYSNTSHGLSMIYHKLCAVYGDCCLFRIGTTRNGYTSFNIKIPAAELCRRELL